MNDFDALIPNAAEASTARPCRAAAARLASDMTLNGVHCDELGQIGMSLRYCFDAREGAGNAATATGDDPFQDLLAKLS
ncbi:hypothetical protein DMP17_11965 [Pseudonocardia sp. TMWB2A]|uniref:hypothetical protein n=1 Tax=Pseudonocardia sp. TMWB2A TaxID=687430 RepID=UPI00307F7629